MLLQGAVMVTLLSVFGFLLGLLRFKHHERWFMWLVAIFSMPLVRWACFV